MISDQLVQSYVNFLFHLVTLGAKVFRPSSRPEPEEVKKFLQLAHRKYFHSIKASWNWDHSCVQRQTNTVDYNIGYLSTKNKPCPILLHLWEESGLNPELLTSVYPEALFVNVRNDFLYVRVATGFIQKCIFNPLLRVTWEPTETFDRVSSSQVNDFLSSAIEKCKRTNDVQLLDQLLEQFDFSHLEQLTNYFTPPFPQSLLEDLTDMTLGSDH